jgi:Mg2+/citrate symporter
MPLFEALQFKTTILAIQMIVVVALMSLTVIVWSGSSERMEHGLALNSRSTWVYVPNFQLNG